MTYLKMAGWRPMLPFSRMVGRTGWGMMAGGRATTFILGRGRGHH